jgi:hypothetical protein
MSTPEPDMPYYVEFGKPILESKKPGEKLVARALDPQDGADKREQHTIEYLFDP